MKKVSFVLFVLLIYACEAEQVPEKFTDEALNETFITLEGNNISFKNILDQYKGKTILLDVWASWCRDCIKGLPDLKAIQKEHDDVVFLFLSLDKDIDRWKKGIKKHQIKGEHFFMQSGWDGDFGEFLDLDWIPRYMVIDKEGKIELFKAVKITDKIF